MKKLISVLLVLLMVVAMAACGKAEENKTGDETAADTAPVKVDTTDAAGDKPAPDYTAYSEGLDDNGFISGVRALDYVTLPDYDPMTIPESVRKVSEEDVQNQIDAILNNYAETVEIKDRAVADGDTVNIDYVGSVDGVEFEGGNTNGNGTSVTIGVTSYIDDFLEQLIGHMPGDNFDIEVTFPDPYENNPDLAGKDAVFNCTVNFISEQKIPELTDQLVAEHSDELNGLTTVADLIADIEDYYRNTALGEFIQNYLTDNAVVTEVPDAAYQYQVNNMMSYYKSMAQSYGMDIESLMGTSEEAFIEQYKDTNMGQAKLMLIIQAIVESNGNIVIDDDVLKDYFQENLNTDDVDSYFEQYGKGYVMMVVMNDTVIDYIKDHAEFSADETTEAPETTEAVSD